MDLKKLTWKAYFETKLTLIYDYEVENTNQLGNVIINLEASILPWKLQFKPGNITDNLETVLFI